MVDTAQRSNLRSATIDPSLEVGVDTGPIKSIGDEAAPVVNVEQLGRQLLGTWADVRLKAREVTARPDMQRIEGLSMADHRLRVLEQLKVLAANGHVLRAFPKHLGGQDDHGGNIAGFEELVIADPSLQIKGGVQWGLFGAAVLHLGTKPHHDKYLPGIMDLSVPGAFAMTEIGHGSDVASIGTTATFDAATGEFVINTPFRAAWKDYLGNAAKDGIAAVLFAQLITQGVNHGVHAFYLPIRDEHGDFLPGVGGEDDGLKGGLNGIDNGRLHFDNVRIPRENLLNRYGDVAEDGAYSSPIGSPGRRFFTMLGTLVQGRVSLDGAATAASALALTIAITYGSQRRQFTAGSDTDEEVILDYQRHQRRLFPRLATTYAQTFAHDEFLVKFDEVFSGKADTDDDRQDLETLAAALKPLSTWHALDTLQEAREACGGAGFLAENRLVGLRADLDIFATFEGDNNVLLQLVAKRLLTDYSRKFATADAGALARYVVQHAAGRAYHGTGLRTLAQAVADRGSTARSVGALRDADVQRELLTDRVESMIAEVAGKLRGATKLPKKQAADLFNAHQNELIEAARAHGELLQWESFTRALEHTDDAGTKQVLTWLRDLFGLGLVEKNLAWYLIHGRLSAQRAQAVTAYIDRLIARIRPHAQDLVDAFGYSQDHLRATIASGAERERQNEARDYYAAQRASGTAPTPEKPVKK
ncbi:MULTISPECIES: acyl-CoA dehydrogenase [Cryobacterium]|uniref:acyl-CoA oxidase n=1 Tax=Cryobacterium levicorallinum TaxID=995038 RepID=A0A1I3D3B5_9MICO|nr:MULTISPECIES: acyl-CoA dehydrogenase [Cryobacterium]TFB86843.1 acyl-CoA dehydrogenase [Cryobacterium levicorallinum]TFD61272.1 acyl-CoA dehydrogenase [Cryobacterium sp. Hh38]GEP28126.1 acyl-CoA dehydrogenase [Cryobacterium levicorallinum]SFH81156.1 Acyl-coenzyme A oxidase [Cryobacterium levicorallinum]